MSFQEKLTGTLDTHYTYQMICDALKGQNVIAGMTEDMKPSEKIKMIARYNYEGCEMMKGLLWLTDSRIYDVLWGKKQPSKACIRKALDEVMEYEV